MGPAEAIVAAAGDQQAMFLFPLGDSVHAINRNAPGSVWFIFDQDVARLPAEYDVQLIDRYQQAFPERPVFLVTPGRSLPSTLAPDRFSLARVVTGELSFLEETQDHRPTKEVVPPMEATIWRYQASPAGMEPAG